MPRRSHVSAAVLLAGTVLSSAAPARAAGCTIPIGVVMELTGPAGEYGQAGAKSVEMAFRDLNAAGGAQGDAEALHELVDVAGLVEDRHDDAHVGPRSRLAGHRRRQHGLLFSGRRHPTRVPIRALPRARTGGIPGAFRTTLRERWRLRWRTRAHGHGSCSPSACSPPRIWRRAWR